MPPRPSVRSRFGAAPSPHLLRSPFPVGVRALLLLTLLWLGGAPSASAATPGELVINEADVNQPGSLDDAEFVELRNNTAEPLALADYDLVHLSYSWWTLLRDLRLDLPDIALGPGELFVLCQDTATVPGCDLAWDPRWFGLHDDHGVLAVVHNPGSVNGSHPWSSDLDRSRDLLIDSFAYGSFYGPVLPAPPSMPVGATWIEGELEPEVDGTSASQAEPGVGYSRLCGADTDHNADDFTLRAVTPGEPCARIIGAPYLTAEAVCLELTPPCEFPLRVDYELPTYIGSWFPLGAEQEDDAVRVPAPRLVCQARDGSPPGPGRFTVRFTCPGDGESVIHEDVLVLAVTPPPFVIDQVVPSAPSFLAGQTVVLRVHARLDGLVVGADLSSLDPAFLPGDETVIDLGQGRYEVAYPLPTPLAVEAGTYPVVVTASDGQVDLSRTVPLTIFDLPPVPDLLVGGFRSFEDPAAIDPDELLSTSLDLAPPALPPTGGPPTLGPAFDGEIPGRVLLLSLTSNDDLTGTGGRIELRAGGRRGTAWRPTGELGSIPVANGPLFRTEIRVPFGVAGSDAVDDLQLRFVSSDGSRGTVWLDPPVLSLPESPPVRARLTFDQELCFPPLDDPGVDNPPFVLPLDCVTVTQPAGGVLVRLEDDCGTVSPGYTTDAGELALPYAGSCSAGMVRLVVYAGTTNHPGLRIAVASYEGDAPEGRLPVDPDLYRMHRLVLGAFEPGALAAGGDLGNLHVARDAGEAEATMASALALVRTGRTVLAYYGLVLDGRLVPPINVAWQPTPIPGRVDDEDRYDQVEDFASGLVSLLPASSRLPFVLAHEVSHLIQDKTLLPHRYGRFGEPMANAMAFASLRLPNFSTRHDPAAWIPNRSSSPVGEWMEFQGNRVGGADRLPTDFRFVASSEEVANECAEYEFEVSKTEEVMSCCEAPDHPPYADDKQTRERLQGDCVLAHGSGWDWRVFFDLLDGDEDEPFVAGPAVEADHEGVVGGATASAKATNHALMEVFFRYLGNDLVGANTNYVDRGMSGLDVVDVLDGMLCLGLMTEEQARPVLHDVMGFLYDFAPPFCDVRPEP